MGYTIHITRAYAKRFARLPANIQRLIDSKVKAVAAAPYEAQNVKQLKGTDAYRLRIGDWRVVYELHDEVLVMLLLEVDSRGGIYK